MISWQYSEENPCPHSVLFIDDRDIIGNAIEARLAEMGCNIRLIRTMEEARELVRLSRFDVVFIHGGLGIGEQNALFPDELIELFHDQNELVRIIINSGIYPYGKERWQELGVDAYTNTLALGEQFLFDQIAKGPCAPGEIARRGHELLLFPDLANT